MLFNSSEFIYFFALVVGAYFLVPYKMRIALLLVASCAFYMAFVPKYILILLFTIILDYFAGILIEKSSGRKKWALLLVSIVANLGVLAFFKYFNFFAENVNTLAEFLNWNYSIELLSIILPVGLSFHTFQAMSYTIEVYRGNQKAERNIFVYALYVLFFPQLVAGPIERPQNLLHQFYEKHLFNSERVTKGLMLMMWGFFKKLVIADRLAVMVNPVFADVNNHSGPVLLIVAFLFMYQIYADFSGYSDIARGSAMVLGFRLMENFRRPFSSTSVAEFWRRWHISLSSWLRDYLYQPLALGGKGERTRLRLHMSLIVTFVIIGLWHGANWTFAIFGLLQGLYLVTEILTEKTRRRLRELLRVTKYPSLHRSFQIVVVFVLASLSFVFFRAANVEEAFYIISHIPQGFSTIFTLSFWQTLPTVLSISAYTLILVGVLIVFTESIQAWYKDGSFEEKISSAPLLTRVSLYYIILLSIFFLYVSGGEQFIYFQF